MVKKQQMVPLAVMEKQARQRKNALLRARKKQEKEAGYVANGLNGPRAVARRQRQIARLLARQSIYLTEDGQIARKDFAKLGSK